MVRNTVCRFQGIISTFALTNSRKVITFRPLQAKDISLLLPMMEAFYKIDNYPFNALETEQMLTEFVGNASLGKIWLILDNEDVLGYVILTFIFSFEYKGKIAFLDELFVSEKARGKGAGKAALDFIQAEAARLSLKLIYLEVEPHNETAQQLYLSKDFELHKRKLMKFIPR